MKFGKLTDISAVDFALPPEPATNEAILQGLSPAGCTLYIGCTGWSMPEWKGTYYPTKTPATRYLEHYSQQFNTIEFNSSHYTIPKVETVKRWKEQSTDDFVFCPKVFKYISHTKQLGMDGDNMARMMDSLIHLDEKLGPFFMQLPPYYSADRLPQLREFYERWPATVELHIELRHESWYKEAGILTELQQLTASYGHHLLITDVAGRRDMMHMRLCGDSLMVRWVGNSAANEERALLPTDKQRAQDWLSRISYYIHRGIKRVYFFTHEPDNILAPDIAAYICEQAESNPLITTRGPQRLDGGSQLTLFS